MLTDLRIRSFAIIESLTLPLAPGLNVLTGETGAGKSIIVGALGILLGERASADLIRTGADRAMVEGVFDCAGRSDVLAAIDELGVAPEDDRLVLRREIAAGGRARAWINDISATAGALARIGRLVVNIHGQHEAQTLLDAEAQRAILDEFGHATSMAQSVRQSHAKLALVESEMASLESRRMQAAQRADYLRHVVQEIETAELIPGEEERLEEEAGRLEHAGELRTLAESVATELERDDQAVLARLAALQRALAAVRRMDPAASPFEESLDSAFYTLQELSRDLMAYAGSVELDPARLETVRARRELIHGLVRKYGGTLEAVIELRRRSRAELDLLDTAGLDRRELERRRDTAAGELASVAARLSELRRAASARLCEAVEPLLPSLGMPDGSLEVLLQPRDRIGQEGAEDVEFRVSLNVGHAPRALAKVASGGELSRVMLALKTVLARVDRIPTLVFDEVDAGIGGRVGLQVGDTLRRVAEHHQVLAISHLPQIASRAHHHLVVTKGARGGLTTADVLVCSGEDRIREIARMLGGDPDSELSRAHAGELLSSAESSAPAKQLRRRDRTAAESRRSP